MPDEKQNISLATAMVNNMSGATDLNNTFTQGEEQRCEPSAHRNGSITFQRLKCGLIALCAFLFPFFYTMAADVFMCWWNFVPQDLQGDMMGCYKDLCFSTLRNAADVAGFFPNPIFILCHFVVVLAIFRAGVIWRFGAPLAVSCLLLNIAFFFHRLPHISLISVSLAFKIITLMCVMCVADNKRSLLATILVSLTCCAGMLVCIVLGPLDGPNAYYKEPQFSFFEYTVIFFMGFGFFLVCSENGKHHKHRSVRDCSTDSGVQLAHGDVRA